ncbi:MAG TPA: CHAD domain-containing protein [Acidimicrobiales bacterium]|nr:CHAD domain-containing protein [Acidimicrobiales bacterium]
MARASRQPAVDAFRCAWTTYLDDIERHWSGAITGHDAEELHDLRIALRRTRALLRYGKGVVRDEDRRRFDRQFRRLTAVTTVARDLDVAVEVVTAAAAADADLVPVLEDVQRRQAAAHGRVADTLRAADSAALIASWRAWLEEAPAPTRDSTVAIRPLVRRRLRRARRRLERGAPARRPDARHEWRKEAKNLRYLVEAFAYLFDRRAVTRLRRDLVRAQDDLGRSRDAMIQVALIGSITDAAALPEASRAAAQALARRIDADGRAGRDPRRHVARRLKTRVRRLG